MTFSEQEFLYSKSHPYHELHCYNSSSHSCVESNILWKKKAPTMRDFLLFSKINSKDLQNIEHGFLLKCFVCKEM